MNWRALVGYGVATLAVIGVSVLVSDTLEDTFGTAATYVVLLLWCGAALACFAITLVRDLIETRQDELSLAAAAAAAALFVLSILVPVAAIGASTGLAEDNEEISIPKASGNGEES
jgi:hypothetical protein